MKPLVLGAVFWLSLLLVLYAYVGYPLLLAVLARRRRLSVQSAPIHPSVSIVIAAHNEARNLERKLANLEAIAYPADLLEIVVVSDGSTDATNPMLLEHAERVHPVFLPVAGGKAAALNHAVAAAKGEILVFMDMRQTVDADAVRQLVNCFADPAVGAVSGALHLETEDGRPSGEALGIYWKIEKRTRKLESLTGSVVGVTGALFAMRRVLFQPLPRGTLLDDVLTPMQVARAGYRVLFLDTAAARDQIFTEPGKEFGRKVRTLTGNYQLLQLAPWLLTAKNPLLFRFVSHKLLRLLVPFLLFAMLCSTAFAGTTLLTLLFLAQLSVYALALLGRLVPALRTLKPVAIPYTFTMLNAAAAVAFYNFLRGRARWA